MERQHRRPDIGVALEYRVKGLPIEGEEPGVFECDRRRRPGRGREQHPFSEARSRTEVREGLARTTHAHGTFLNHEKQIAGLALCHDDFLRLTALRHQGRREIAEQLIGCPVQKRNPANQSPAQHQQITIGQATTMSHLQVIPDCGIFFREVGK
jgi:hypothetical protein